MTDGIRFEHLNGSSPDAREIGLLRARIASLEAQLAFKETELETLSKDLAHRLVHEGERARSLEAQLKEAREALEGIAGKDKYGVTLEDFRRARVALAKLEARDAK